MKTSLHHRLLLPLLATALLAVSCQKALRFAGEPAANHQLTIRFKAMADTARLIYGNTYLNNWSEPYTVSAFKFYISQLRLINTDSGISYNVNKDEYFLVNFGDSNSVVLRLNAVPFRYDRIGFLIGVDSIRNVSGAQTGALDPGNGMFWTWNSGYIMAKLEGNSPVSNQVNNKFEYHIGGFSGPDHVLKQVSLSFPLSQEIVLQPGKSTELTIAADANAWFSNPFDLKLSVNPVCMTPGPLSRQIAENYVKMFSVTNIVNQ
ncbi:MAG: MbnP family protein [Chitinophagaceae bacterium]